MSEAPNIAAVHYCGGGSDGVSIEMAHVANALRRSGKSCNVVNVVGRWGNPGERATPPDDVIIVPLFDHLHPDVRDFVDRLRQRGMTSGNIKMYRQLADEIFEDLRSKFPHGVELVRVHNIFSMYGLHPPAAAAMIRLIHERGIPWSGVHHDFTLEGVRFPIHSGRLPSLEQAYVLCGPIVDHALSKKQGQILSIRGLNVANNVINSHNYEWLSRMGYPNLHIFPDVDDFDNPPSLSEHALTYGGVIGVAPNDVVIMQSTRIVPRKAVEVTIKIASGLIPRFPDRRVCVVLPNHGDDEPDYERELRAMVHGLGMQDNVIFGGHLLGNVFPGFGLDDVHGWFNKHLKQGGLGAFFYPTRYEGFGNQILEAVRHRIAPIISRRYPVATTDIEPLGFEITWLPSDFDQGDNTESYLEMIANAINISSERRKEIAKKNFAIARQFFSYSIAAELVGRELERARSITPK